MLDTLHFSTNQQIVRNSFTLIILDASFNYIRNRISNRPLYANAESLYEQRRAVYLNSGNVVNVENRSVDEISAECISLWKEVA